MSHTIKVLHTEWSDGWGGQEIRIIEEMCAVRERGVEVMLACREKAQIRRKALERDIPVFTFPFRGNTDLHTLWGLVRLILSRKVDIVNTHSGKDTWVGGLAAKLTGAKFIRTRHLASPINPSRINFINELADFVVTTGETVRIQMIRHNRIHPNKIISVPTGVDQNLFNPSIYDREKIRYNLGLKPKDLAVGALGVIRGVKRHEDFILAASQLKDKHPNLRFFIGGDGPRKVRLEMLAKSLGLENQFTFLGHLDQPAEYLAALDIFVNPSESEGVPQAVIQALMMNLPVIATDVGSTRDLYTGKNLLLIEPRSQKSLTEAIETLIDSPNLRKDLAAKSRSSVREFSRERMVQQITDIYEYILGRSINGS